MNPASTEDVNKTINTFLKITEALRQLNDYRVAPPYMLTFSKQFCIELSEAATMILGILNERRICAEVGASRSIISKLRDDAQSIRLAYTDVQGFAPVVENMGAAAALIEQQEAELMRLRYEKRLTEHGVKTVNIHLIDERTPTPEDGADQDVELILAERFTKN